MVKIQSKTIRKRCKSNQPPYIYKQHLMPFPLSENEGLTPFLKQKLQFSMIIDDDTLTITPKKEKTQGD